MKRYLLRVYELPERLGTGFIWALYFRNTEARFASGREVDEQRCVWRAVEAIRRLENKTFELVVDVGDRSWIERFLIRRRP